MSDAKGNRRSATPRGDGGVLLNLPRTRPQRSSARRAAARKTAAGEGAATGTRPRRVDLTAAAPSLTVAGSTAEGAPGKPTRTRAAAGRRAKSAVKLRRSSSPAHDPAPRQGFESDSESMSGSIHPPGGAELLASAAEIVGELAKAGLSTGERVLRDALSRLPGS